MHRRDFGRLLSGLALTPLLAGKSHAAEWDSVLSEARGQTVYWHAWGGDPKINAFIGWVGEQAQARYGVGLEHVKLASTADAVSRVQSEKAAGVVTDGAVDLVWINGENFAALKGADLLFGPFAEALPNWPLVDTAGKPATVTDFTVPTAGYESPWAMAQLVFEYDSAQIKTAPQTVEEIAEWVISNPGRFTYPQPPDYLGVTFLKQVLYGTIADPAALQLPVDDGSYAALTAPLWAYLDRIHPALWREARAFPANEPALGQLLADGEIFLSFAFNPGRASAEIAAGSLPDSIRTFTLRGGTIGNASFVAIPFNATHQAGAQVIANLLLDPEVQAHAQDPAVLGFQTVLDVQALADEAKSRFDALDLGVATLSPADLGPALLEPHASWATRIAEDWTTRYGVAK